MLIDIIAGAPCHAGDAGAAGQRVVAGAADQRVVAGTADDRVGELVAGEHDAVGGVGLQDLDLGAGGAAVRDGAVPGADGPGLRRGGRRDLPGRGDDGGRGGALGRAGR